MKPLFLNSAVRPEISAGLGDQGSQVRVPCLPDSQPIALRCNRFHWVAVDSRVQGSTLRGLVLIS